MTNTEDVFNNLNHFREKFNIKNAEYIKDIVDFMKEKDDILVLKFPNEIGVSGMFTLKKDRNKEYKCIYINTNETKGRQNFTFVHELYHAYYEKAPRGICKNEDYNNPVEKRADVFASNILIPRLLLLRELKVLRYNQDLYLKLVDVFKLQKKFNVSAQAIIYAVDSLRKDERYTKYKNIVPIVDGDLKKYYKSNWKQLERLTLEYDSSNKLNSYTKKVEFPLDFKENIINNYKKNLITYEDARIIFGFFNEKFDV